MTYGSRDLPYDPPPPPDPLLEASGDDALQFGGVAEIAAMLGVPRSTVSMWDSRRGTNGYPEPVARLTMGPVYDLAAVRAWHQGKGAQS